MPIFEMNITETYTNTFLLEADDLEQATELAEEMAVERRLPTGCVERCEREIAAEMHHPAR